MEKDKQKYALVNCETLEESFYRFVIVRIGEPVENILTVNTKMEMDCSCTDWRIRCRGLSVPCKHIYYLLVKILTYQLFDYFDNQILQPQIFRELINARINFRDKNFHVKNLDKLEENVCCLF